jgi:steroid delta-isomerase-like uncharacterized protein
MTGGNVDPKELIQVNTDTWNGRDQEAFFATYTEDCELTAPGFDGKGRQGLREFWSLWMSGFPDNQVRVRLLIAEGDHVVEESVFEGTNSGPLRDPDGTETAATGRSVSTPFAGIHTVHSGKIARSRIYFDEADVLSQLGLMPS